MIRAHAQNQNLHIIAPNLFRSDFASRKGVRWKNMLEYCPSDSIRKVNKELELELENGREEREALEGRFSA